MSDRYIPRLSIDIPQETQFRLQRLLPWGLRGRLFLALIEDVLDLIEEHGEDVIALFIAKRLRARDIIMKGVAKNESEGPKT